MNVSAWCIRNPIAAIMFFVMLCFAGTLSYQNMKVQNFPDLEVPNIIISASLPGASPAQLETDVARKIENSIASLNGLKNIYTKVQDGSATITAEFRLEKPTQEALDEVRSAVQQVRADLPSDVRDPVVSKVNISGSPVLAYAISSKTMDDEAMSWFVDDTLNRRLLAVKGVGSVTRVGGVTREVRVALDQSKMASLGISPADVSRQLRLVQLDTAGGRTDLGSSEQPVRTLASVKSASELSAIELSLNGRKIRLDQIAEVKDTVAEQRSAALLNGKSVLKSHAAKAPVKLTRVVAYVWL
jgi:multidrug efflux pump subunit AcrB